MSLFASLVSGRSGQRKQAGGPTRAFRIEPLESRVVLSADFGMVDDLAILSDEFDDAASISAWQRVHEVENWNADHLQTWDVDQTQAGRMVMQPHTTVWYQDWRGPMAFQEVTGDFVFTSEVHITDRDDVGGSDADDVPSDGQFSLGGLMIRTPRAINDPTMDWSPGSQADDGTNNGENYVFLSLGYGSGANELSLEVKTTRNSNSQLELTPVGTNAATLRIARIGDSVIALYRLPGQDWQVHRRYTRTDMPDTLQVGLVSYTNWEKASDFDPFTHNSNVLSPGQIADPTPGEAFNPDITAGFEYARYARPQLPAELEGVDLVNAATDDQLLSFLGDGAAEPPASENQAPVIDPIADQATSRFDELRVAFNAYDPDGDPLAVSAGVVQPLTYQLDQQFDFTTTGNFHDNWGGQNERWINGEGGAWFYLLQDGDLYRWEGSFEASSLMASLGSQVYDDPTLLTNAQPVVVDVQIDGDEIVIAPVTAQVETIDVMVTVDDGQESVMTTFDVAIVNPELGLTPINDIVTTADAGPLDTQVEATWDGAPVDPGLLTFSVQTVESAAAQLDAEYDLQPAADFYTNWGGQNEKWLRASNLDWYYILPDGGFYRWGGSFAGSELLETLESAYYEDPNLIADPDLVPVDVSFAGDVLTINPDPSFVGGFEVVVTVSDGFSTDSQIVNVTVQEQAVQEEPLPVLMVIANQDFYYQEYGDTRQSLEAAGLEVVVAAATTETATPHANSGQGSDGGFVQPDLALSDINAEDYSAIVFVGGWGSASYQYGFEGTYHNSAYNSDDELKQAVNDLINDFVDQDKYVAAICHGVSVLAWARVDGESLLEGRTVSAWAGSSPGSDAGLETTRQEIELNGGAMVASASVGDPTTAEDDVIVDGSIITAENFDSASLFGRVIAEKVQTQTAQDEPLPVLIVIANQDFYYQEYGDTRQSLEAAGLEVVVAAATTETATPHANSGQGSDGGFVQPDLALADVNSEDYSAIVFVGGWGSSSYQYAYEGTYDNNAYNGDDELKQVVNDLINDFVDQDKYVAAICHGVSVLAWARVDGESLLEGRTVSAWAGSSPDSDAGLETTRQEIERNGGTMVASGSVGDPTTTEDDVIVDGNIITAENFDSASLFGSVIADLVYADADSDSVDAVFSQ